MAAQLRLTGFLESFNGEPCLLLQVQWKNLSLQFSPTLMASSLLRIPYHSPSRLPPSPLDLERYFFAAEFSPGVSHYLDRKIASFVLDLASAFAGVSPPSLFILAEIETRPQDDFYGRLPAYRTLPLMPRRLDPVHQPQGMPLLSRLFINDHLVGDYMGVSETEEEEEDEEEEEEEEEDSPDQNWAGASLQATTKLREVRLEKEVSELGECSVCLQEMCDIKEVMETPCNHVFHAECILHWRGMKNTCPLCRSKLDD